MFTELVEELVELTDTELDDYVREQELLRRQVDARLAAAVAVAEGRALNERDSHRSMSGYLRATINPSAGDSRKLLMSARTVNAHPEIGDAWLDGRLGPSQVAELARTRSHHAAERFGEFVSAFVEQGERLPFREFQVVLQRFLALSDADGKLDERNAIEGRSATIATVDGQLHLRASGGDALAVAEFEEILHRFEQAEHLKDLESRDAALAAGEEPEPYRSGPQRRFDALMAMARSAARHEGELIGSEPLVSMLVDQRTVSAILARSGLGQITDLAGNTIDPITGLPADPADFADLLGHPDDFMSRRIETTTGTPLKLTDVLRGLISGHIRRVVLGANSRVIDMGRNSRVFTGAARDAARLLTVSCEHPGCEMPAAWCQVDHSTEWHQHGTTDQANAATLCGYNNREKHQKQQTHRRDVNGRLHTFRADGTIILPVGTRPPPFPDEEPDGRPDRREPDRDELAARRQRLAIFRHRRPPIACDDSNHYRTLVRYALDQRPTG